MLPSLAKPIIEIPPGLKSDLQMREDLNSNACFPKIQTLR